MTHIAIADELVELHDPTSFISKYIDLFSICEDELRFAHGADFPTFKSIELECLARADRVRVQVYDACATEVDNGGCGG